MGSKTLKRATASLRLSSLSNARPPADVVVEHRRITSPGMTPKKITAESLRVKGIPQNKPKAIPEEPSTRLKTLEALGSFTRKSIPSTHHPVPVIEEKEEIIEVVKEIPEQAPTPPSDPVAADVQFVSVAPKRRVSRIVQADDVVINVSIGDVAKLLSLTTRILFSEGGLSPVEEMEFVDCVARMIQHTDPRKSKSKNKERLVSYFVDGVTKDVPIEYVITDLVSKIAITQKDVAARLSEKLRAIYR